MPLIDEPWPDEVAVPAVTPKVVKIDHTGHVNVTLAWADEPGEVAEE